MGARACKLRDAFAVVADLLVELRPHLLAVLLAVSIALLGLLAHAVRVLQSRAVTWLEGLSSDARWRAAIGRLDAAAEAAVDEVEQRLGGELRRAEPDPGKLSASQAQEMAGVALDVARRHFSASTWEAVASDLDLTTARLADVLTTRIEAAVRRRKIVGGPAISLFGGETS